MRRIYICHTFYHAYIACLKEQNLGAEHRGEATLMLSRMSNDFGSLDERATRSGLFDKVVMYDELRDWELFWIFFVYTDCIIKYAKLSRRTR